MAMLNNQRVTIINRLYIQPNRHDYGDIYIMGLSGDLMDLNGELWVKP